jgi:hypothetical protein
MFPPPHTRSVKKAKIKLNNRLCRPLGKEKAGQFQLTYKQVGLLEKDVHQLKKEEAERNKVLLDLGAEKDRIVLAIAQKHSRIREVGTQLGL